MKSLTKLFLFALSIFVYGCNSLDIKPLDIITDGDILSSDYVSNPLCFEIHTIIFSQ